MVTAPGERGPDDAGYRLEAHDARQAVLRLELTHDEAGAQLKRTWGPLGRPAAGARTSDYADPEEARRALERQLRRATHKGYWVGHHAPDMIRAIRAAPDRPEGYLVYGDWLLERDDPRGALIGAQDEDARARLIEAHPWALFPREWNGWVEAIWAHGFVAAAVIGLEDTLWTLGSSARRLRRVLRHPSMHLSRALVIRHRWAGPGYNPWTGALERARGALAFEEAWAAALHELPSTVRAVGVGADGPLAGLAARVLPEGQLRRLEAPDPRDARAMLEGRL